MSDQRLTYRRHTQITLLSKLFHRRKMTMFNRPAIGTRFLNHNETKVQELSAFEKILSYCCRYLYRSSNKNLVFFPTTCFRAYVPFNGRMTWWLIEDVLRKNHTKKVNKNLISRQTVFIWYFIKVMELPMNSILVTLKTLHENQLLPFNWNDEMIFS